MRICHEVQFCAAAGVAGGDEAALACASAALAHSSQNGVPLCEACCSTLAIWAASASGGSVDSGAGSGFGAGGGGAGLAGCAFNASSSAAAWGSAGLTSATAV